MAKYKQQEESQNIYALSPYKIVFEQGYSSRPSVTTQGQEFTSIPFGRGIPYHYNNIIIPSLNHTYFSDNQLELGSSIPQQFQDHKVRFEPER